MKTRGCRPADTRNVRRYHSYASRDYEYTILSISWREAAYVGRENSASRSFAIPQIVASRAARKTARFCELHCSLSAPQVVSERFV